MQKVRVQVAGRFVPHSLLLDAAARSLEAANAKSNGLWWDHLSCMLYCALSLEALGNTYGETFVPKWKDFESASPKAKIRLVAERAGLQPDFSTRPWGVVSELIAFRNIIAHAKPESIEIDEIHTVANYEERLYAWPKSKLESKVTAAIAQSSYDQIQEILAILSNCFPREKLIPIEFPFYSASASVLDHEPPL